MAIEVISKFKPKNNQNFPIIDAEDIAYKDGRLPDFLFVCLTDEEYQYLRDNNLLSPNTPYIIVDKDEE